MTQLSSIQPNQVNPIEFAAGNSGAWDGVRNVASNVASSVGSFFSDVANKIGAFLVGAKNFVSEAFVRIKDSIIVLSAEAKLAVAGTIALTALITFFATRGCSKSADAAAKPADAAKSADAAAKPADAAKSADAAAKPADAAAKPADAAQDKTGTEG